MSLKDWMKRVESAQLNEFATSGQVQIKPASQMPKAPGQQGALGANNGTQPTTNTPGQPATNANTQVITQGNKTLGTVNNPQLAQQIKQSIGKGEMSLAGDQLGEDEMMEVAPPGMEDAVLALKKQFPGNPGRAFATAWSMYNKKHGKTEESMMESKQLNEGTLEEIIGNHPHEHKMCQEGWGMDNSLFEALADHYFKEGRIPRSVWHGSAEELREFVESCYAKDTMGANEDMINSGMLDEEGVAEGIGGDMAKLIGIPVVAGAAAIGAQYYDDQQPHVQVGGQNAKIVRADSSRIPDNAMIITGKDGKQYRVWQQSGKGMSRMTFAAPVQGTNEGVAEGSNDWSGPLYDPALQGNGKKQRYEMMFKNGQVKRFSAMNDNEARKIAAGHGAKSVIQMKGNVPGNKIREQGVAEGNHDQDAMELNPDLRAMGRKPQGAVGKFANKVARGLGKVADFIAPGDDKLLTDLERSSGGKRPNRYNESSLEETSELEQMLRQSTKENTMYESKKSKKAVEEAVEKTKTGIKHRADAGGYGRKDDEEDTDEDGKKIKKVAKDEPKKGRGRPKKTDNASGEDKKFDFSALSKTSGSKAPKDTKKGKVIKGKAQSHADNKKEEELDESKLKGGQKKLDINKNGKVDGGDFAMLRGKKKKDPQMESWDRQLKGLLTEGRQLNEGLTVSTSVGNQGGQDTVSITASDTDAHQLLQMLQNAGMGSGVPHHAVQAATAPAQVLPKASPATTGSIATTDGAPNAGAQKDIDGAGNSVPIMAMPRGMAFSVNDETEMPTEPGEFGTLDQEEVVSALGSEQGSADDSGDSALAAIKKLMGQHGASEVTAKEATPPESKAPAAETEVEESDTDGKKPDEDDDGVPDWADKKPGKDDNEESEDDSEEDEDDKEKVEEGAQTCNECGGLMEDDHSCGQLNEWSNSPQGQSDDEQFETDMAFMTKVLSGGLNGQKSTGQATTPILASQTNRQMSEGYNIDVAAEMRKLAGIR